MSLFTKKGSFIPSQPPLPGGPGQKPEGKAMSDYRVLGVWGRDGAFLQPATVVVELERPDKFRRRCRRPGDLLRMTRREAAVVGKHIALAPVTPDEAA